METKPIKGFGSSFAFIMAAAGSAVGLGNIWKFPFIAGENGGGAFVLFYLLCIVCLGVPVMLAEIFIGKRGQAGPIDSFSRLAESSMGRPSTARFRIFGYMFLAAAFILLSFYGVVGGWSLHYTLLAMRDAFGGITPDESGALFGSFLQDSGRMIAYQIAFMALVTFIVARGVSKGIERWTSALMPLFFVLLLGLTVYAMAVTGAGLKSFHFMFNPDFSKLTPAAMVEALGHAFFSLSLGLGGMLVYGQYMPSPPHGASVSRVVAVIVLVDTLVALCAGLMIFAVVFAQGGENSAGPGLLFISLPVAFGEMPGGYPIAVIWFALIIVAALTSGISMLAVCVDHFEHRGFGRVYVTAAFGVAITVLGFGSVWAFGPGESVTFLGDRNFFATLDFLTSNIALPVGGMVMIVVCGWFVSCDNYRRYLPEIGDRLFGVIYILTRYVAPMLMLAVMINLIWSD